MAIVSDRVRHAQPELRALCREYRVKRLELYGSAARGEDDPTTSDYDFLVEFLPLQAGEYADCYFGLREGLENVLGRRVDLSMLTAIKNAYFLEQIESSRVPIYEA